MSLISIHKVFIYYALIFIINASSLTADSSHGVVAYDCTDKSINITAFSLTDVTQCQAELRNITTKEVRIQVLQAKHHFDIPVYQCKVVYKRMIHHCGMMSHISLYDSGYKYILKEFTTEECMRLHTTGSLQVQNELYVHEIPKNHTSRGMIYVSGSLEGSKCSGSHYFDGTRAYSDALVSYEYEITLGVKLATLDTTTQELQFKSGLSCQYPQGSCIDAIDGYMTWSTSLDHECSSSQYTTIYEGRANRTSSDETSFSKTKVMYTTVARDRMFSIRTVEKFEICGFEGYSTDHSNVYILEINHLGSSLKNLQQHTKDLNIFTYFNSKITLVEHHIQNQLTNLYQQLIYEICRVEKSLLETRLIMARINPQEFASSFMKRSGYTAVIAGEVIYLIECKAVYVTIHPQSACYQEVPVNYNGDLMFLSPVTRIIQRHGTETECTPLLMTKFKFGDRWFNFDNRTVEVKEPYTLSPEINDNWAYDPLPNLMSNGVYDPDYVKRMHDMIYEHDDKRAASGVIYRIVAGRPTNQQNFKINDLVHEDYIESKIKKYWTKFLDMSTAFGQVTSSVIGIWIICKCLKYAVDSIIHGRILFEIYGFSWRLVAALWDSLAVCMTHRYLYRQNHRADNPETISLDEKPTDKPAMRDQVINHIYPNLGMPTYDNGRNGNDTNVSAAPVRRFDM